MYTNKYTNNDNNNNNNSNDNNKRNINNNIRRPVTLAEHTSDHGKQTKCPGTGPSCGACRSCGRSPVRQPGNIIYIYTPGTRWLSSALDLVTWAGVPCDMCDMCDNTVMHIFSSLFRWFGPIRWGKWPILLHYKMDALCYVGCEEHRSANGLPQRCAQLRMELAERSHGQTYLGWYCWS